MKASFLKNNNQDYQRIKSLDVTVTAYSYIIARQYVEMTYFCMEYIRPAPAMAFNSPFYLFYLLLYASSPFSESC